MSFACSLPARLTALILLMNSFLTLHNFTNVVESMWRVLSCLAGGAGFTLITASVPSCLMAIVGLTICCCCALLGTSVGISSFFAVSFICWVAWDNVAGGFVDASFVGRSPDLIEG